MSVDDDPFAPVEDPQEKPSRNPRKLEVVSSEEAEFVGEVGLSVKFGSGYEAPMFHVKANNVYALAGLVGYEGDTSKSTRQFAAGLMDYWTNVARVVQNNYKESRPALDEETAPKARDTQTGGRSQTGSSRRPTGRTQREADDADTQWMYDQDVPPECEHGEWRPVTKKKPGERRWFAWGCPGPRGDSCDNGLEFVSKN